MSGEVNVSFHNMDPVVAHQILQAIQRIERKVDSLSARMTGLTLGVEAMSLDMSSLEAEVSQNSDVVDSASTLLATLAEEIRATAGDPAKVAELAQRLDANSGRLAAAVAANTPAAAGGGGTTTPPTTTPTEAPPQFGDQPPTQ